MRAAQPSESSTHRPVPVWWRRAQWVVVPLLLFGAGEWLARRHAPAPDWYAGAIAETEARDEPAASRLLLVGSSRVALAVDSESLRERLGVLGHRYEEVQNFGQGYSTLVEHQFGIERLLATQPETESGQVTVLIELAHGLPRLELRHSPWYHPYAPQLLGRTMGVVHLPAFWSRSGGEAEAKLAVSVECLLQGSRLWATRRYARRRAVEAMESVAWLGSDAPRSDREPKADLVEAAGVRADSEHVTALQAAAIEKFSDQLERPIPPVTFNDRFNVVQLVQGLQERGVRVLFFYTPMHPLEQQLLAREENRRTAAAFEALARTWGTPIVQPDFPSVARDYPDFYHLAASRRVAYSHALAEVLAPVLADLR